MIRNGHDVINFSYRDYSYKDVFKKMTNIDEKILDICNNYKPDLLVCGHNNILNQNGLLILSTPLAKPGFLWAKKHFHEMSRRSIYALFESAGFKIMRHGYFRVHPFLFYTSGIRPMMRLFFDKIQIYELVDVTSLSDDR